VNMIFFASSLITVLFLITACGDLNTASNFTPTKAKLDKYEALEIYDFESAVPNFPKDALSKIPSDVEKLLSSKNNTFKEIKRGDIKDIPADKTLVLLGEITEYVPGSDFKFEGGAVKFGEVTLSLKLALVQKDNGREITRGDVTGFSSLGILRKGYIGKSMYESLAEEIVKFIVESY